MFKASRSTVLEIESASFWVLEIAFYDIELNLREGERYDGNILVLNSYQVKPNPFSTKSDKWWTEDVKLRCKHIPVLLSQVLIRY